MLLFPSFFYIKFFGGEGIVPMATSTQNPSNIPGRPSWFSCGVCGASWPPSYNGGSVPPGHGTGQCD